MKSTTNKRKNSQRSHTSSKLLIGPNGPINYVPPYIQQDGVHITCNVCNPPVALKTREEEIEHDLVVHQNKQGR